MPQYSFEKQHQAVTLRYMYAAIPNLIAFPNAQAMSLLIRATAFVFSDPQSQALLRLIERVAPSEAAVLISGETGTGKELVARHVHGLSQRKDGAFVAVNCGAFSENLIEAELFGHERGAFTGATQTKAGWFEAANGGTLFLDEIGDLPLAMQVKLLRVLQEREVVRVGSRTPLPIDVRLIAATNVNLREAVRSGHFRQDLYYRLQVVSLPLLPLRQRVGDILPLAQHFVQLYGERMHLPQATFSSAAQQALQAYPWPGNIRELENVVHRALLVSHQGHIEAHDLQLPALLDIGTPKNEPGLAGHTQGHTQRQTATQAQAANHGFGSAYAQWRTALAGLLQAAPKGLFDQLVDTVVRDAYAHCQQNQVQTARLLGISRNVLRTHLKKMGLLTPQTAGALEADTADVTPTTKPVVDFLG